MSLNRHDAKRDANEAPIVDALVGAGCLVERMSRPVDLAVWSPFLKEIMLLEVKTVKRAKRSSSSQAAFIARWQAKGAMVVRVTSPEQALVVVGARDGSTVDGAR